MAHLESEWEGKIDAEAAILDVFKSCRGIVREAQVAILAHGIAKTGAVDERITAAVG